MQKSIIISHDNVLYYDDVKTDLPEIFKKVNRDINKRWKIDYYNMKYPERDIVFYNKGISRGNANKVVARFDWDILNNFRIIHSLKVR